HGADVTHLAVRLFSSYPFFSLLTPPPPRSTLFPYTTLFRSLDGIYAQWDFNAGRVTRFYNPRKDKGVAIDGRNDDIGNLDDPMRSEEHTSELQSLRHLVCRLLLEKKKKSSVCRGT